MQSGSPDRDLQSLNFAEVAVIPRHDDKVVGKRRRSDQEVMGADELSSLLQAGPEPGVETGYLEGHRQNRQRAQNTLYELLAPCFSKCSIGPVNAMK